MICYCSLYTVKYMLVFDNKIVLWMCIMSKLVFCWAFPQEFHYIPHAGVYHNCRLNFLEIHKMSCIWHPSISKLHHFLFLYFIVLKQSMFLLLVFSILTALGGDALCLLVAKNISECLRIYHQMPSHLRGGSVETVESVHHCLNV